MKGAITEPWVKTINAPIRTIVIIKGANQYFFLTLRKSHISLAKSKNASIIKKFYLNQFWILPYSLDRKFPR